MSHKSPEHQVLSVELYVKTFFILLLMIFLNVGISMLPLPSGWLMFILLTVATIQAIIVCLFFMELIHEDKFYSFIWGSCVLFMLLFFGITLFELHNRGAFDRLEGIHYMRKIDRNGVYAPAGPEMNKPSQPESGAHESK